MNEAGSQDVVVAFVGKPHRIDDRSARTQVAKALKQIGYQDYYQAEQMGWVFYLEGSTDLSNLRSFAKMLNHSASEYLARPFVHYVGNQKPFSWAASRKKLTWLESGSMITMLR